MDHSIINYAKSCMGFLKIEERINKAKSDYEDTIKKLTTKVNEEKIINQRLARAKGLKLN